MRTAIVRASTKGVGTHHLRFSTRGSAAIVALVFLLSTMLVAPPAHADNTYTGSCSSGSWYALRAFDGGSTSANVCNTVRLKLYVTIGADTYWTSYYYGYSGAVERRLPNSKTLHGVQQPANYWSNRQLPD